MQLEARAQTAGDHVARQMRGREFPEREDRRQTGAGQLAFAIGADVAQEEIAERDGVEALGDGAAAGLGHARFVLVVGAGPGQRNLPQRQAGGCRLRFQQRRPHAVHGDAIGRFVEGGEQRGDFDVCRRSACSVQALSLPELQASRTFFTRPERAATRSERTTARLSQACRPNSTAE